jgi:Aminoglycoside-2''-adenylyltransferase
MTAEDALEVVGWLSEADVDVWLLGGWSVDALVGEQTRKHKDLDLSVRDEHVSRMSDVLKPEGTARRGRPLQSFARTPDAIATPVSTAKAVCAGAAKDQSARKSQCARKSQSPTSPCK